MTFWTVVAAVAVGLVLYDVAKLLTAVVAAIVIKLVE